MKKHVFSPLTIAAIVLVSLFPESAMIAQDTEAGSRSRKNHMSLIARDSFMHYAHKTKRKPEKTATSNEDTASEQSRIVGGSEAPTDAYPWIAALVTSSDSDLYSGQFCAGTLVHPYWIVTAAHCVDTLRPGDVDVVLGVNDLDVTAGTQRINVAEIIVHPLWRSITNDADVALLRLETPADPSYTFLPIIDDVALDDPGVIARAIGWGNTSATDTDYPTKLHQVDLPLVSNTVANTSSSYDGQITDYMLAAGLAIGGIDTCQGDSGGPLIVPSPIAPGWMLGGVVSWGNGCAQANYYGIYSRMTLFRDFAISHIFPGYGSWEARTGAVGEFRDDDGDNRNNFEEFSFLSDTGSGTTLASEYVVHVDDGQYFQAIKFIKPINAGEVDYEIQQSDVIGDWATFDIENNIVSTSPVPGDAFAEYVTVTSTAPASSTQGFLRARATKNNDLVNGIRTLDYPGRAQGSLTSMDEEHPTQSPAVSKTYRLEGLIVSEQVSITCRSVEFDSRLELLNEETGVTIQTANSNGAGGSTGEDEILTFYPQAGISYLVRVSSIEANGRGFYKLGAFKPSSYSSLPALTVPTTINGSLSNTDPWDSLLLPGEYRSDDYRLIPGANDFVRITISSTAIDAFVEIVNAETGEIVTYDDDSGGGTSGLDAQLSFAPISGVSYIVRVTSAIENQTGAYSLVSAVPSFTTLSVPSSVNGTLIYTDETDPNFPGTTYYKDDFLVTGISGGETLTIYLNAVFDAYLYVIDANTGDILASDDDGGTLNNSLITYTTEPGSTYFIRASSAFEFEVGAYGLIVQVN